MLAAALGWSDFTFSYSQVMTQAHLGKHGRADLMIEGESFYLLIECKANDYRGLTPNQPAGYLKYLAKQTAKQKALLFLVSFYYQREELIRLHLTTGADAKIKLKIIYWTDLLDRLTAAGLAGQNIAFEHFVALLRTWFEVKKIEFSEAEMKLLQNKAFPAQFAKLLELLTEVSDTFPKGFKTQLYGNEYGLGYYVIDQQKQYVLWFGCDFQFCRKHDSLFQIGVGDDDYFEAAVIRRFRKKYNSVVVTGESGEWYYVPIPLERITHRQNVKQLIEYIVEAAAYCSGTDA